MQMRHGFAGIGSIVKHKPKPVLIQSKLFGDFSGLKQKMSEDLVVGGLSFSDAWDGLFRDDQDMSGSLGFDVAEGDDFVVFVEDGGRDFAGNDLLKQCFAHDSRNVLG